MGRRRRRRDFLDAWWRSNRVPDSHTHARIAQIVVKVKVKVVRVEAV